MKIFISCEFARTFYHIVRGINIDDRKISIIDKITTSKITISKTKIPVSN